MEFEIILIILSVLVVTTNMAVIAMVIFIKELRSFTNYFVVSLAVSDALMGALWLDLHFSWIPAVDHVAVIIMLSCVGNICAVTWDRYTAVMDPFMYRTKLKRSYRKLLVAVWLIAISYSLVPLAWQADRKSYYHKTYLVIAVLALVILPLLVISIGYVRIFARLRYHTAQLKNEGISRSQREGAHRASLEGKTVKVFVVIVIVFLLSWLPVLYMTLVLNVAECPDLVPSVLLQANLLALALSSLVDPILYAFMKRDFNRQIQRMLRCCKYSMTTAAQVQ